MPGGKVNLTNDQSIKQVNQKETTKAVTNTTRAHIAGVVISHTSALSAEEQTIHNSNAGPKTRTTSLTTSPTPIKVHQQLNHQNPQNLDKPILLSQANKLPTPVQWSKLQQWLKGYDKAESDYLISGFKHGFRLGFTGPRTTQNSPNLPSALSNNKIVNEKIKSELAAGRIAGPFDVKPLNNLKISPLGLVPKNSPGEFRLIHHLSWPRTDGSSVNDGIPHEFSRVQYAGIQEAISKVKLVGKGCFLAKTDIQSAFRIVPVHPEDYELLGFSWEGKFYYDRSLAFGASSSCRIFERISSALEWIALSKLGASAVVKILDDFLFIENTYDGCLQTLQSFLKMCNTVGIPIADKKTFPPHTTMTFVGFSLDSLRMETSLPSEKLSKARNLLIEFTSRESCKLRELQSLLGFLNFCCSVITCGRAFLRRLTDLTIGVQKPYYHIRLTKAVKDDLRLWLSFIDNFNGKCMFINERFLNSDTLQLYTDSAKSLGYGAVYGTYWLYGSFPTEWKSFNITFLELYPIVLAVHVWASLWKNHCILFHTDNLALVSIINNQTSKDPQIMKLLRVLILACLKNNILFQSRFIEGRRNVLADCLSRLQVRKFRLLSPTSRPNPHQVPQHLIPENILKT